MSNSLLVPDDATKYILYQRTDYLSFPKARLYRIINKLTPFSFYSTAVRIESFTRGKIIRELYRKDMSDEYQSIKEYLPDNCSSVLDIGCGVAGIDVFLSQHYTSQKIDFFLLDKSKITKGIYYRFNKEAAFYNSLQIAGNMLAINGIPLDSIHLMEACSEHKISMDGKVDLVLSLISWGYHYPLVTYLDEVVEILNERGVIIIDLRMGTDGMQALQERFEIVDVIFKNKKQIRVRAIKNR